MAHLLTPAPPTTAIPISTRCTKKTQLQILGFQRVLACQKGSNQAIYHGHVPRRAVVFGLTGAVVGLIIGDHRARAARRPPPPPPPSEEKKDPNVSGVLAKVLASKSRKEAMKESIAKLREKGKAINEPSE